MNEALKVLGMTEEKAISILERLIAEDEDIDFYSLDEKMAFEMAISALKDRPKGEYVKLDEVTEILADVLCIPDFFDRNILESDVSKAYDKIIDLDRVQI